MKILIERDKKPAGLGSLLQHMDADPNVMSIMVLAADGNGWIPTHLDGILKSTAKPVFGGIFPQILYGNEHLEQGVVVIGLPYDAHVAVIEGLSDKERNFEAEVNASFSDALNGGTMFTLVDGFSRRISSLIDALYNTFGLAINYLGGGGGSLSLKQTPCVITPNGLRQDVAVLAYVRAQSGVGVAHGWEPISNTYRVTESAGNEVISLDWRPAFEVYREIVETHADERFTNDNFFSIAKAYPLGIAKLGAELIVRDPIVVDGNKLVCVGEVPTGGFVQILHGNQETLLAAARQALNLAGSSQKDHEPCMELFIDCISRVLYLENKFGLEIVAAHKPGLPLVGMLSIGEIANSGRDYLEFYNKTSVVALI